MSYIFNTHTIFEIISGNEKYEKYKDYTLIVSVLNIAELYGTILREFGKQKVDNLFNELIFEILEITPDLIIEAVIFRYENRKEDVSLPDAVGYLLSKKYNLKFLTGDKFFKDKDNVEFVQK